VNSYAAQKSSPIYDIISSTWGYITGGTSTNGDIDVTAETGVDPTGATDSTAGINAAIATGKAVHVPCGTYHITDKITVGTTGGQKFYGDGMCTVFTVSNDFSSSATAVFNILTNPSYNTWLSDFQIQFTQPADLSLTTSASVAAGTNVLTLTSTTGVTVGQNVVDQTTNGVIPIFNAATAMTTVTAINGNQVTLSQNITGAGVGSGDTILFGSTRAQAVAVSSCTLAPGSGICKYPPAISGVNVKRPRIENVRIGGSWDAIKLFADAEAYVQGVELGAFDVDLSVDDFTDNGYVNRVKCWVTGMSTMQFWVAADGNAACLNAGRTDGGFFGQIAAYESNVNVLSTWTSGIMDDLYIDGIASNLLISPSISSGADLKLNTVHVDTNGTPLNSACMFDIGGGHITVGDLYIWAQSGNADGICVRNGVVTLTGGQIATGGGNHGVNQSGGNLNLTGLYFRSAGGGQSVPEFYGTAGTYQIVGNAFVGPFLGGVNSLTISQAWASTDLVAANAIPTGNNNWLVYPAQPPIVPTVLGSPWHFTAQYPGTLYVVGGTVSSITITRNGTTVTTGMTSGSFVMTPGDQATISYSAAPTLTYMAQ
jgi:hypothetical protein